MTTRQTSIQFDKERKSVQFNPATDQQIRDLVISGYGSHMTEVLRHAVREAWERRSHGEWWHWAVRTDVGCRTLHDLGVRVNTAYPWRSVSDDSQPVAAGWWRIQPWCDPDEVCQGWGDNVASLRAELGEDAGVFYAEHVTASEFQPRYDTGYLVAVTSDGERAAFRKVLRQEA